MSRKSDKRLLVIQTAFIGDVILATGIIEKLGQYSQNASIDVLVRKGNESLLENNPHINEVLVWDKKSNKLRNLFKMLFVIRKRNYEKVINVHRFASSGFLTAFSGAKETIGFNKNPLSFLFSKKIKHVIGIHNGIQIHEIERNHELIKEFTDAIPAKPALYPSAKDEEIVNEYKKGKYITISPASVWYTKQYPKNKWVELIDALPNGVTIYLNGGVGDTTLAEEIRQMAKSSSQVVNLCGKLTFLCSAALMKNAVMNYVNDSAPLHIASAINAPVTAVFCSTAPFFGFTPLSDQSFIVETTRFLDCRPCGLHGHRSCPKGHFFCAMEISKEQLLQPLHV